MANAAVAAAPTADAEGRPAQPDPGGLRLAEAPTPLMNEPTAPNRDVRIAQLTETFAKLMNALGEKTEAAAAAKIAAEKAKAAAETAVACYVEGKNGGLGVKRRNVKQGEQTGRPPGRPPEG